MDDLFMWMPIVLPIVLLASIWIPIFYLRSSDHRQHQKKWRDLAKLSGFSYHTPKDFARGMRNVGGIDAPKLGSVQQAISGQLNDCWVGVAESIIRKHSLRSAANFNALGERTSVAFCILVVPTLRLPEFCLCKKSGRGLTAAVNGLLESSVDFGSPFTQEYYLRGESATALQSVFNKLTQRWYMEEQPLGFSVTHPGDIEPTEYQLELHAKNQTLTLCCIDTTINGKLNSKSGPLPARDIQKLLNCAKAIRDCFLAHSPAT